MKSDQRLDGFDIALLNLLQSDNQATAEALSAHVALSPSAITRRIRRLRADGLIAADVSLLAPALTEGRLRAIVQVQAHDHAEEKGIAALRARLAAADEVQMLLDVAGPFDLVLLVVARDMAAFNAFAHDALAAEPAVRRYETTIVRREIKHRPTVTLDDRDRR